MPLSGCCIRRATRQSGTLEQVQERASYEADQGVNGLWMT